MNKEVCRTGNRCAAHTRRSFLLTASTGLAGLSILDSSQVWASVGQSDPIQAFGPASNYTPHVQAAFVRRKDDYGMRWPGAVYDGAAAKERYTALTNETAKRLGVKLDLRKEPIHNLEEAESWIRAARSANSDGLFLLLLDRQEHTWPTAELATESGIPTVIFSPLGSSFTTNTIGLAEKPGSIIYSTDDFSQPAYGVKMLVAAAKMKRCRCVVLAGEERRTDSIPDFGIELQYIPATEFLDHYRTMGTPGYLHSMADEYIAMARVRRGATREDVLNGIKSYCVAGDILKREQADAITMDCLGALGKTEVSLPCIAWSRMNDDGIPAACEADLEAVASHIMVQYLLDRPGFQQDPVADTLNDALIGAHCSCPTRLNGFQEDPEPFDLVHHHGERDAVPRTIWKVGQRVTCLDVLLPNRERNRSEALISEGTVIENIDVPPAGGCVVSVRVKFDGDQNVLTFPGFHQLFFYGEYGKKLREFCQLCGIDSRAV